MMKGSRKASHVAETSQNSHWIETSNVDMWYYPLEDLEVMLLYVEWNRVTGCSKE